MTTPSTLGKRIAQARRELAARKHRDITQADVAKAAGVTAASVSEWEADKKSPREATLAKLAKFLEVTPAYLRYGATAVMPALRADTEQHPEGSASELARENERTATTKRTGGKKRPA